jgi:hypothetical protein
LAWAMQTASRAAYHPGLAAHSPGLRSDVPCCDRKRVALPVRSWREAATGRQEGRQRPMANESSEFGALGMTLFAALLGVGKPIDSSATQMVSSRCPAGQAESKAMSPLSVDVIQFGTLPPDLAQEGGMNEHFRYVQTVPSLRGVGRVRLEFLTRTGPKQTGSDGPYKPPTSRVVCYSVRTAHIWTHPVCKTQNLYQTREKVARIYPAC